MCRATIAILRHDRHGAAADPATQQTGEKELSAMGAVQRVAALVASHLELRLGLAGAGCLPNVVSDDPKFRDLDGLPLIAQKILY